MSIIATAVKHLIAAGVSGDDLVRAIAEMEDSAAPQVVLSKRQERNKRHYERLKASEKRLNASEPSYSDGGADLSSPSGSSPKPLSPNPLQSIPPSPPKGGSSPKSQAEFETEFWAIYPHKVGKPVAIKAFVKARQRAGLDEILAGLRRYAAKVDDRPWCNPSTWLNQDRWNDTPAVQPLRQSQAPPRERTVLDAVNDRLREEDAARYEHPTIDHEPITRPASPADLRIASPAQGRRW